MFGHGIEDENRCRSGTQSSHDQIVVVTQTGQDHIEGNGTEAKYGNANDEILNATAEFRVFTIGPDQLCQCANTQHTHVDGERHKTRAVVIDKLIVDDFHPGDPGGDKDGEGQNQKTRNIRNMPESERINRIEAAEIEQPIGEHHGSKQLETDKQSQYLDEQTFFNKEIAQVPGGQPQTDEEKCQCNGGFVPRQQKQTQ